MTIALAIELMIVFSTMTSQFDLAIKNGLCVLPAPNDPDHLTRVRTSIAILNGKIAAIGDSVHEHARDVYDASGLVVLPGVIDSQVHFREPGLTQKEDLESGSRGAVLGGVTTVFEMPNTKPATTSADAFRDKLKLAAGRMWTDYAFFIGATPDNVRELGELERLDHCCAVKVFMGSSTGSLLVQEEAKLRELFEHGTRRVAIHAEDEARLQARRPLIDDKNDVRLHPFWRDEGTAIEATTRALRLAREVNRPVHILHVTTAEEMELLKAARDIATCEVTPQHLTLAAPDCYESLGSLAQMNPPIRSERHREALWRAVADGTVTVIGSDHAPHTREEKALPHPQSPSGMTGVQTLVPIMLNHVNDGKLSLERFVELSCRENARLYGAIGKGEIRVGFDADFTIVDLARSKRIENSWIASRVGWSPYDGLEVRGWPITTIVGGNFAVRDEALAERPTGTAVSFR